MPKLHIYINGTPNATDGTEIEQLTLKNLKAYTSSCDTGDHAVPTLICLRFDSGYKGNVTLKSLHSNISLRPIGTAWGKYSGYLNSNNVVVSVTDKNYLCAVLVYHYNRDSSKDVAFSDMPLQDILSFSYTLEKA